MKKAEFIKKLNIPNTPMSTWLDNFRFSKYFQGKEINLSAEFFKDLEFYIDIKAKKDYRAKQYIQRIQDAKELLTTP